jgi:poly(3-hydroxybutyrate) depolymerase
MKIRTLVVVVALLLPATALAQALTSLASVRVAYITRKNTVKPQGELKTQIDAIDQQIAEASRLGRTGELRRLYSKGMVLMAGRQWTETLEFLGSLVIRTDHIVTDSTKPLPARLEQIYMPSIALEHALTAHVVLRERPSAPAVAATAGSPVAPLVKDLGTFEGVGRDLRESPFPFEADVRGVADGVYTLSAEMSDQDKPIGLINFTVSLRKGLDDLVSRLESDAKNAPEPLRTEILFPVDRLRAVNRGRLELRTFDADKDFAAAEAIAAAAAAKKDPFAGKTGDVKRHYRLDAADEILPYRLYVPTTYTGAKPFPLILALHGLGGTEDAFFDNYNKTLPPLAEQHGYIVAAPLGYRVDGGYGWGVGSAPADPAARRSQDLSEQDVMQVLQRVRQQYKIDDSRIYLLGHSLGAIGAWKIAAKFPDVWAAIAPISGAGQAETIERFKHVPVIVVHGDNDPTVNVNGSRTMVAKLKELGVEYTYIEVPGGVHSDVVAPNLAAVVTFFDAHKKAAKPTSQP